MTNGPAFPPPTHRRKTTARLARAALVVAVAAAAALPSSSAGRPSALTCPSADVPLTKPGSYGRQGHLVSFRCSYSDGGLVGFELALFYYERETPPGELPTRSPTGYCSSYAERPRLVWSPSHYAYASVGGNPKSLDAAFEQAKGLLGQAAAVARPCAGAAADTRPPVVAAIAGQGIYPNPVRLRFRIRDDSGQARVGAVVFQGRRPIYRFPYTGPVAAKGALQWFRWKPPARFRSGMALTFCVSAVDAAGNTAADCAPLNVLSP